MHEWRTHYPSVYHHKQYAINQKKSKKKKAEQKATKRKRNKTKIKKEVKICTPIHLSFSTCKYANHS